MKRIGAVMMLGGALWCGLSSNAALAQSPRGKAYGVHVFSSFGTQFDDCFVFDRSGTLNIQGYGPVLYRQEELNTQPEDWQATARTSPPFGFVLAFNGSVGGSNARTIVGNGVSSEGNTFILQGVLNAECASSAPRRTGTSPYKH